MWALAPSTFGCPDRIFRSEGNTVSKPHCRDGGVPEPQLSGANWREFCFRRSRRLFWLWSAALPMAAVTKVKREDLRQFPMWSGGKQASTATADSEPRSLSMFLLDIELTVSELSAMPHR